MKNINVKKILKVLKIICVIVFLIQLDVWAFVNSSCAANFAVVDIFLILIVSVLGLIEKVSKEE